MNSSRRLFTAFAVLALAGAAIAGAVSTNFIADPITTSSGGAVGGSTNFAVEGAVSADMFTTDHVAGNQANTTASTNFVFNGGFGGALGTGAVTTALAVFNGPANPGPTNEIATTTQTIPMLQVLLTAGATQTVTFQSIVFTANGTGDDINDLAAGTPVSCIIDANQNGVADIGEVALAPATGFSSDNGTATFTPGTAITINPGTSLTLLLQYQFNGTGTPGSTFFASLPIGSVSALDGSSNVIAPSGLPRIGNTKTLVASGGTGTLTVALGTGVPSGPVPAGAAGQAWMLLEFTASSAESVRVSGITFTASGTLNDALDIDAVTLFDDFPGSTPGQLDPGDAFIASGSYTGDDGQLNMNFASPRIVPAGGKVSWLVVYDLAASAPPGATGTCAIVSNADVAATGLSSQATVVPVGGPVGAARVIANPELPTVTVVDQPSGGCSMVTGVVANGSARWLGMLLTWLGLLSVLIWRRREA